MTEMTHPLMAQLRQERIRRGWKLDNIARRLGTRPGAIWNWELRGPAPRIDKVAAYANVLGMELALIPKTPHHAPHHTEERNTRQ